MKHFYKLFLIALFIFGTTAVQAQDENNPWQISVGSHSVDLTVDENTKIPEFFDVNTDWNMGPAFSMFSVSRYLSNNISFGIGGSMNMITKYPWGDGAATKYNTTDAMLKYSFGEVFECPFGSMEPFIGIGPGWTWMGNENWMTGNLSFGANHWFNDKWGITFQADYKHNYDDAVDMAGINQYVDEGGSMRWSASVSVKFGGTDTDGDGIYDKHDDCPLVAGLEEFNGCPDTDGDGIPDNKDRCPKEAGKAKLGGCPDSDGDGIVDARDNCPNVAGPRGNRGCPWPDSDGDSVLDKDDECPDIPGTVANNGCPEGPSEEDMARITELSRGIAFGFGEATFSEGTPPVIDDIVTIILKYPKSNFSIEGHTDSIGTKAFNQGLSERRAAAVVDYLVSRNISSSRLSMSGYGESMPIDTNVNSAGRANNRRVEILFVK